MVFFWEIYVWNWVIDVNEWLKVLDYFFILEMKRKMLFFGKWLLIENEKNNEDEKVIRGYY